MLIHRDGGSRRAEWLNILCTWIPIGLDSWVKICMRRIRYQEFCEFRYVWHYIYIYSNSFQRHLQDSDSERPHLRHVFLQLDQTPRVFINIYILWNWSLHIILLQYRQNIYFDTRDGKCSIKCVVIVIYKAQICDK